MWYLFISVKMTTTKMLNLHVIDLQYGKIFRKKGVLLVC